MIILAFLTSCLAISLWPFNNPIFHHHNNETENAISTQFDKVSLAANNVTSVLSHWDDNIGVRVLFQLKNQMQPLPGILNDLKQPLQRANIEDISKYSFANMATNLTELTKMLASGHDAYDDVGMATSFGNILSELQSPLIEVVSRVSKLSHKDCDKAKQWKGPTNDLGNALSNALSKYGGSAKSFPSINDCDSMILLLNTTNSTVDYEFINSLNSSEFETLFGIYSEDINVGFSNHTVC